MRIKLLGNVVAEIAGKQSSEIVDLLIGKKDVNEFLIAKKMKLTINQVRNILYKLANFSLVTFTRKKDRRKGWYTYFWTLDIEKTLELLANRLKKEAENLRSQLKSREIKRFYFCKTCKTEVGEEMALLNNFICQECGEVYELADNKKIINELEKNILRLGREKEGVLQEIEKIRMEKEKKSMTKKKEKKKSRKKEKKSMTKKKVKKKKSRKKKK